MARTVNKRKTTSFIRSFIFSFVASLFLFLVISGLYLFQIYPQKKVSLSPLPKTSVKSGTTIDINALEKLLKQKNIAFSFLTPVDDRSFLVGLSSGEEIIFSSDKPLEAQVSSLQLISQRLTIEGKRMLRLDFRFDKPVIIFRE